MLIKLFGLNSEIMRSGANFGAVDMEGIGVNVLYEINIYVHNLYLKIIFDICIDCELVIYVEALLIVMVKIPC